MVKKIVLTVLVLALAVASQGYAGGNWNGWILFDKDHEVDPGRNPYFIDNKTGWLVDVLGFNKLSRTDDGGHTWQKQNVGIIVRAVFFVDKSTGWAVGHVKEQRDGAMTNDSNDYINVWAMIKHTTDGGKTWEIQYKKSMGKEGWPGLAGVFFIDHDTGWVAGNKGTILHTTDGGLHWVQQKSGDAAYYFQKIYFINSKAGWAMGCRVNDGWTGIILHTEDGGNHWKAHHTLAHVWFGDIAFTDEKVGWVIGSTEGETGVLLFTNDGGATWSEKKVVMQDVFDEHMVFLDKGRGVVYSSKGWIWSTADGGKTWNEKQLSPKQYPWHFSEVFESISGK